MTSILLVKDGDDVAALWLGRGRTVALTMQVWPWGYVGQIFRLGALWLQIIGADLPRELWIVARLEALN